MNNPSSANFNIAAQGQELQCSGEWTMSGLQSLLPKWQLLSRRLGAQVHIRGEEVRRLDSSGAWLLARLVNTLDQKGKKVEFSGFNPEQQSLIELVLHELSHTQHPPRAPKRMPVVQRMGRATITKAQQTVEFITFFGEMLVKAWGNIFNPRRFQWISFLNVIDTTGFQALAIVGTLNFLIGVVLAYQTGQQLKFYGANVYVVSILGIGILQEFAPLITAIIVAARTSSAFTAQIGTMIINEEVDALRTMGLSPVERLVIPKIAGLLIALPLLVIWADIFGLLGGMIVSKDMLNISFYSFIERFPVAVHLNTFLNGMLKAPFFAVLIAGVGCFQGFRVAGSADSVGRQTTKSVVQAIFLIIIADAVFSVILPWQNI